MTTPAETVLAFIRAINSHDVGTLTKLMTPDHEFIDSLGASERGRDRMRQAWIAYFYMVPDYTIDVARIFADGASVAVTARASGTVASGGALPAENRWEIPMAALALVRDGCVERWQVFADNEPVRRILNRA